MVELALCVAGQAGDGVVSTGRLLERMLFAYGYWVSGYQSVPSRIRGGDTALTVRVTDHPHTAPPDALDLLIAFDPAAAVLHAGRLRPGGVLIVDPRGEVFAAPEGVRVVELELAELARRECGRRIYKSGGAAGVAAALLGLPEPLLARGLAAAHGAAAVESNLKAARAAVALLPADIGPLALAPREAEPRHLLSGNEAVALGALAAGCRFVAAYPITPATGILTFLSRHLPALGGKVVQAEDELAAVNMCLGAAWGGARAMTSTSGPGLNLMAEGVGFGINAEVGIVIVDQQRPGPATGMPTRTEQGDLLHAVHAGHGGSDRIVLSPATVEECFYLTAEAFNLADRYQVPVIVLSQQFLAQNTFALPALDLARVSIDRGALLPLTEPPLVTEGMVEGGAVKSGAAEDSATGWFPRFAPGADGVSPRVLPGTPGGLHLLNANEHGDTGHISYDPTVREAQVAKRHRKLAPLREAEVTLPDAESVVISWGATWGPVHEALSELSAAHLHLRQLWPLPRALARLGGRRLICVENNQTGQLAQLLATLGLQPRSLLRCDGTMFGVDGLRERLQEALA